MRSQEIGSVDRGRCRREVGWRGRLEGFSGRCLIGGRIPGIETPEQPQQGSEETQCARSLTASAKLPDDGFPSW